MKSQTQCAILIVIGICLVTLTACLSLSTATPVEPAATPTQSSAPALANPQAPWPTTDLPTARPMSDFSITVTLTTMATEVKVGDVITLSLVITNTGKMPYHRAIAGIDIFLEDGKTWQSLSDPILEPLTRTGFILELPGYDLNPGESVTANFVLRAVRPGTVIVKGGTTGQAYYQPGGATFAGGYAIPIKIDIRPANP